MRAKVFEKGCLVARVFLGYFVIIFSAQDAHAVNSVTDLACNSGIAVTVASNTRSSATVSANCQQRNLTTVAGFSLTTTNPADAVKVDSSAFVSAGGELYKSFVAGSREAAVLLTPNRAFMMSRYLTENKIINDWNMDLAVQPVTGGTNAWLIGSYALMRANRETRIVDTAHQINAALSEVFDPVTMRITFDGHGGCSASNYSSWFSYSLTTDPANAFSQPNGNDYGLHQAVYAGVGYAGSGGVHEGSVQTFTSCSYALASDGKLFISYAYNDGLAVPHSVENSYYVSSDLRYLVSTVDITSDLYRGFEVGVRIKTIAGAQDVRNNGVAGTYLFNAPTLELQGSTGILTSPDVQHRNDEKITRCMSRGSINLTTTPSGTIGWNNCTWNVTNSCEVLGEEGIAPNISLASYTAAAASPATTCRFQVASDSSLSFVVNSSTAEGMQDVTYDGAMADNNQALVLRGKYVGTNMTNPSATHAPQRTILNDLILSSLVGIKYTGDLTADADSDGKNNYQEFVWANSTMCGSVSDFNCDGVDDILMRNPTTGQNEIWLMQNNVRSSVSTLTTNATTFEVAAILDGDNDGDADILWYDSVLGKLIFWQMQNGAKQANVFLGNTTATLAGLGDFDGDGDTDILLKTSLGDMKIWTIQNLALILATNIGPPTGTFKVISTGDFNGDGIDDIVMQNTSGLVRIWQMNSSAAVAQIIDVGIISTVFKLKKSGDTDDDGDDDLVFRNDSTGQTIVWEMQNGVRVSTHTISAVNPEMQLAEVTDFDKDGDVDLLFRDSIPGNASDGQTFIWTMQNNLKVSSTYLGVSAVTNIYQKAADFDGDGDNDILYRDSVTGALSIWNMQNGARVSTVNPGTTTSDWSPRF